MIPKVQDVIPAHQHDKLLIVRTKGLVAIDESLNEPEQESVLLVFWPISSLQLAFSPHLLDSEEAKIIEIPLIAM